jgi:type IV pilus assembly protein PilQ
MGLALLAVSFGLAMPVAAQQGPNALNSVSFTTLPGNRLQIALTMASTPPEPQTFTIDNPARIALDLPNTTNNLATRVVPIGVGIARSISTAEAQGRTRVVLNLASLAPYQTSIEGNTLYLTLEAQSGVSGTLARSTEDTFTTQPVSAARALVNVDFRRGESGEGRVIVTLSDPSIPMDINEEGGQVIVDFLDVDTPDKLIRRLDVLDFATPVKHVDTVRDGRNARIIISPINFEFEQLAYQSDNVFTVEIKPIPKEVQEQQIKERFGYTGERLSLNFQDIEVRSVLQLLADFTGINIVVSDTVTGRVTLRLKNVPWDQALDIILKTKALAMRKNGNIILVAPTEELAAREKLELEALQQVEELAPLRTEMIQVNYAKAGEIEEILRGGDTSLLSERGSVTTDNRTNTLLVQDTEDKLSDIRALVTRLDVPVRQVLIESRIVIANDDFNKELGARFGVTGTSEEGLRGQTLDNPGANGSPSGGVTSGNLDGTTDFIEGNDLINTNRWNVNLPATNPTGQIALALAKLPFGTLLELELSAMQAEGQGEVVSSPRVITANQREALIEQGVEIPYLEASSSGAATIAFRKAVLALKVTPQITPDERIIMDLVVNNDTVGERFGSGALDVPSIDTREVSTQVLVNNGETVVLGGVYQQVSRNEVNRVPFFSDLPLVGVLFRNTEIEDDKTELLVFVTPKIIKESIGATASY